MGAARSTVFRKNILGDFIGASIEESNAGEPTNGESAFSQELNYITKNIEPVPKIRPTTVNPDDVSSVTYPNGTKGLNRMTFGFWVKGDLTQPFPTGIRGATLSKTVFDSKEYLKYGVCFAVIIDYSLSPGEDTWFANIVSTDTIVNFDYINTANNLASTSNQLTVLQNTGRDFRNESDFTKGWYGTLTSIFPFSQYLKEAEPYGVGNISCGDLLDPGEILNASVFGPEGSNTLMGHADLADGETAGPDPVEVTFFDNSPSEIGGQTIRFVRTEFWRTQGEDTE